MRKPSKMVPRTELDACQKQNGLLDTVLNRIANDEPDAWVKFKIDGPGTVYLRVYGASRADGGVVHETYRYHGQRDAVRVDYYTTAAARWLTETYVSSDFLAYKIAYANLRDQIARKAEEAGGR